MQWYYLVKTEHDLSFTWDFICLNQPLSSFTQLLFKQLDFQVSISHFPRTGESPPTPGSLDRSQRGAICRQVTSFARPLGPLGERKQEVSDIREATVPFHLADRLRALGCHIVPRRSAESVKDGTLAAAGRSWGGKGGLLILSYLFVEKTEIWDAFVWLLLSCSFSCRFVWNVSSDCGVRFGRPIGERLSCDCSGITVVS